jgi:hypothetical protein
LKIVERDKPLKLRISESSLWFLTFPSSVQRDVILRLSYLKWKLVQFL